MKGVLQHYTWVYWGSGSADQLLYKNSDNQLNDFDNDEESLYNELLNLQEESQVYNNIPSYIHQLCACIFDNSLLSQIHHGLANIIIPS